MKYTTEQCTLKDSHAKNYESSYTLASTQNMSLITTDSGLQTVNEPFSVHNALSTLELSKHCWRGDACWKTTDMIRSLCDQLSRDEWSATCANEIVP